MSAIWHCQIFFFVSLLSSVSDIRILLLSCSLSVVVVPIFQLCIGETKLILVRGSGFFHDDFFFSFIHFTSNRIMKYYFFHLHSTRSMWLCVVKLMTAYYLFVHIFILCVCVLFAEFINADHRFRGVCFFYICLCSAYILTAKALIESEYEIERARALACTRSTHAEHYIRALHFMNKILKLFLFFFLLFIQCFALYAVALIPCKLKWINISVWRL